MRINKESGQLITGGVVTFLDILGWKGVYSRKSDAIHSLLNLISDAKSYASNFRGRKISDGVSVHSISDTLAFFTRCQQEDAKLAIEMHGELCAHLIPISIISEIPVRGATAFGSFELRENDNIFVGKAIDEAAAWHEEADWIGVNLTPSAQLVYGTNKSKYWIAHKAPCKIKLDWDCYCVNWTTEWINWQAELDKVTSSFQNMGPLIPEIAGKYINTLSYLQRLQTMNK